MDFVLCQYASSSLAEYHLFTINEDGLVSKIQIENEFSFIGMNVRENSVLLTVDNQIVVVRDYDNTVGIYFDNYYRWDQQESEYKLDKRKEVE